MTAQLEAVIDAAWDTRDTVGTATTGDVRDAVNAALSLLDGGERRVAEKVDGVWTVNQWLKKAVLLSFPVERQCHHARGLAVHNLVRQGTKQICRLGRESFPRSGLSGGARIDRAGRGSHIGRGMSILMPSFVNIGASVGDGSMVDAWATVGSLRADREECPPFGWRRHRRGARAAAGGAGHHRRQLLHRRKIRSGRRCGG
jgi:2,3,4,5-tetrahydropyridine-2-carboxylate N-succinyltransferase